jgi:uncharacterized protein (DUF433 family)
VPFTEPVRTIRTSLNRANGIRHRIGTLLNSDPSIRAGLTKIAGTGITVRRIAGWYKTGMTPEEIAIEYPHLNLAQVHAALAYYHANRDEIETDNAQEEVAAAYWEQQFH